MNRAAGGSEPPVSWGCLGPSSATLLWGWDRTGRDGIRQDGIGWGRPHSPRCPNMQVQGNDPRAAPSAGNRQNLLFVSHASPVSFCICRRNVGLSSSLDISWHFAFLPAAAPCSAPLPGTSQPRSRGQCPHPLCPVGQCPSRLQPGRQTAGKGHASSPSPLLLFFSPFFYPHSPGR